MKKIKELFKNKKAVVCAVITLCLIGGIAVGGYAINTAYADNKTQSESTKIAKAEKAEKAEKTEKTETKDSSKAEKSLGETASATSKGSASAKSSSSSSSSSSGSLSSSGGSSGSSSGSASSSESTGHVHSWVLRKFPTDSEYAHYCPNCCVWYGPGGCPSCGSVGFESGTCVTEYTLVNVCSICGAEEVVGKEYHDISEGLQS